MKHLYELCIGAGTGKTKVLTRKVAYLINDLNVPCLALF
ncbi:UvrD-helicase domain-containing protein [Mycoplasmopsis cynos]|nr:UvrD-helicase domain-containing protein [Mycoplasmopsis cynos]WAM09897.1 UvrD-helicase domain-containing protein [Mycoplasmopsis cynos]